MARIVPSKLAPDVEVHYSLGMAEFVLAPGDTYETSDTEAIGSAVVHPWLDVEYDKAEAYVTPVPGLSVDPKKDPLSAQGPDAGLPFDIEAVKAANADAFEAVAEPTAIEASLKQTKVVKTAGVNETVAADEKATASTNDAKDKG